MGEEEGGSGGWERRRVGVWVGEEEGGSVGGRGGGWEWRVGV